MAVPSRRSVPIGLPVDSSRPGAVEHVVGDLERQAEVVAVARAAAAAPARRHAAEAAAEGAGRREQAARS